MAKFDDQRTQHTVAGCPVAVLEPAATPLAAVIWLHDTQRPAPEAEWAIATEFAAQGLLCACPEGGQSWWLDQPCAEFAPPLTPLQFVAGPLVDWISQRWSIAPPHIALAGSGAGGQGAVNLGFRQARRFPVIAAIAPDIDFHQWHGRGTALDELFPSREAARQQTATLHLHPLNWPRHLLLLCGPDDAVAWDGTERLASKLISSGIPFECDFETRTERHSAAYLERMLPRAARFIGEQLRNEASAHPS